MASAVDTNKLRSRLAQRIYIHDPADATVATKIAWVDVGNGTAVVVTRASPREVHLVDLATNRKIPTYNARKDVTALKLDSNRLPALLAAGGHQVRVWEASSCGAVLVESLGSSKAVAFAFGGSWLAVMTCQDKVHLLSLSSGELVHELTVSGLGQDIVLNPAGDQLFILSSTQIAAWSIGNSSAKAIKSESYTHRYCTSLLFDRKRNLPIVADSTRAGKAFSNGLAIRVTEGANLRAHCSDDLVVGFFKDTVILLEFAGRDKGGFREKRVLHELTMSKRRIEQVCNDSRFVVCLFDNKSVIVLDFGA